MEQIKSPVLGIIRHLLTIGCGYLVGRGVIDGAMAETLIGAGMGVAGVVWSVMDKQGRAS